MTYEPSRSTEHLPPPAAQAEEGFRWFAVIGTGAGVILVFVIATFIVYRFLDQREKALQPLGPDPIPAMLGQPEIGIVDQVPFDVTRGAQAYRRESFERLSSWGWLDRQRGVIHIPIDRAMELVLQQQPQQEKEQKR
jgi:hypothetical protein